MMLYLDCSSSLLITIRKRKTDTDSIFGSPPFFLYINVGFHGL